nr:uncharacterized protein LOC129381529 [Dermacentor andersoni]
MRGTLMTVAVALNAAAMEHSSVVAASAGLVVASTVPAGQVHAWHHGGDQFHSLCAEFGSLCKVQQLTYHVSSANVSIKPGLHRARNRQTLGVCHAAVAVRHPASKNKSVSPSTCSHQIQ